MPYTIISDIRKRIVELANEIAKDRPGIEEDALVIRLHRALRLYTYQRRDRSTDIELVRIGQLISPDPLEPELGQLPRVFLRERAERALRLLNLSVTHSSTEQCPQCGQECAGTGMIADSIPQQISIKCSRCGLVKLYRRTDGEWVTSWEEANESYHIARRAHANRSSTEPSADRVSPKTEETQH